MTDTFVTKLELYVSAESMEDTAKTVSQMLWRQPAISGYRTCGYWTWKEFEKLKGKI